MPASVEILAETPLPTEYGDFRCLAFRYADDPDAQHIALVRGEPGGEEGVPVRVHSECFTGEALHSVKCDCREQLSAAMEHIARHGSGAIVYLRQEGRGIGLVEKLRAYALQESEGLDTVDANRRLGLPDDSRSYDGAAALLSELGIESIVLLTNNPRKVEDMRRGGIEIAGIVPLLVAQGDKARTYLATKVARMGHVIDRSSSAADEDADAEAGESVG